MKDQVIYTPQLGTILAGITRETIIKLAGDMGFKVVQKNMTLDEAYAADEAFFSGTAAEVTAIRSIDDKLIGAAQLVQSQHGLKPLIWIWFMAAILHLQVVSLMLSETTHLVYFVD